MPEKCGKKIRAQYPRFSIRQRILPNQVQLTTPRYSIRLQCLCLTLTNHESYFNLLRGLTPSLKSALHAEAQVVVVIVLLNPFLLGLETSVEVLISFVLLPSALDRAPSAQAHKRTRVLLGDAERLELINQLHHFRSDFNCGLSFFDTLLLVGFDFLHLFGSMQRVLVHKDYQRLQFTLSECLTQEFNEVLACD